MGLVADVGLVLGGASAAAVAALAWRNRPEPGATALVAFMATLVVWEGFHLGAHGAPGGLAALFERLKWLGLGPMPLAMVAFVLATTGRADLLTRRVLGVLAVWPVALNLAIWLPGALATLGLDVLPRVWPAVADEAGAVYHTHLAIAYGALLVSTGYLVWYVRRQRSLFRTQGLAVLGGLGFLYVATALSVLDLLGDLHVHTIPMGLAGLGVSLLWATSRGGLADLVPVANATVLDRLPDAVMVVDDADRVLQANPAARELFGLATDGAIGEPVDEALADQPALVAAVADRPTEDQTVEIDERVYDVRVSPLAPDREPSLGAVLICRDVTAAAAHRAALERQNERLDEFASFVSHDLRNPLTVAEGNLELASKEVDSEYLDRVDEAHDRMWTLIDDLLTLARSGQAIDELEPVALDAVAADTWDRLETADATLEVAIDRTVRADPTQLERLLENLYTNAVEHGGKAVEVTVGSLPEGGFYVADDGPGVSKSDPELIFEPGETSGSGAGLGLAIVRSVAQAHGWSVTLAESATGGARFEFRDVEPVEG